MLDWFKHGVIAFGLALSCILPAIAQNVVRFDRDEFGKIILQQNQAADGDFDLELAVGSYNNEPINSYSATSVFSKIGRAVGRLDILTDAGIFPCTAFIISDAYLLTNHHCVPGIVGNQRSNASHIQAVAFVAGYVRQGDPRNAKSYNVAVLPVEASEELDYAILEVFGNPAQEWGVVKLSQKVPQPNDPFWVIGHPMGEAQRISREKCKAFDPVIISARLQHTCDTLPGNSGSPVIDSTQLAAVGLHHAGSRRNSVNRAIPMHEIARASPIIASLIAKQTDNALAAPQETTSLGAWKFVVPAIFDDVGSFKQGLAAFKLDGKWGYMNKAGEVVVEPQFEDAKRFVEGLARVKKNGKWGFLNLDGALAVKAKYEDARVFADGMARFKRNGKWGYIDQTGTEVVAPTLDDTRGFSEGLARFEKSGQWGFIDKAGRVVIAPQFEDAQGFYEGLARIKRGGKWGYIDPSGNVVIAPQFDDARNFDAGAARIQTGEKWGFIRSDGQFLHPAVFEEVRNFSQGLARFKTGGKWGYIDQSGKVVIAPLLEDTRGFAQGLARTKHNGHWGFIDMSGDFVIPPLFDAARGFAEGFARVKLGEKWGYIDKKGDFVVDPVLDEVSDFSEAVARVQVNKKWGLVGFSN